MCRGKCWVLHLRDIREAGGFAAAPATFFYILGYNPENNRLASIQGEIRVGPSHQVPLSLPLMPPLLHNPFPDLKAKLPEWRGLRLAVKEEAEEAKETLVWAPGSIADSDLHTYVGAVRSLAAFAGFQAANGAEGDPAPPPSRDHTHIAALHILHEKDYAHGYPSAPVVGLVLRDGRC